MFAIEIELTLVKYKDVTWWTEMVVFYFYLFRFSSGSLLLLILTGCNRRGICRLNQQKQHFSPTAPLRWITRATRPRAPSLSDPPSSSSFHLKTYRSTANNFQRNKIFSELKENYSSFNFS